MGRAATPQLVNDFLGSTQVFATALMDAVEKKLLHEVAGEHLSRSQFMLLKLVAHTDTHSIGDVAAFLGVSNAAASKAVDKLVRRNLLARAEDATDRRAAELSLTPGSRRVLAAYDAARDRKLAEVFRTCSPKELKRTAEILDRLSAGILDHSARTEEICLECGIYFRENCLVRKLIGRRCFYTMHKARQNGEPAAESGATKRKGSAQIV